MKYSTTVRCISNKGTLFKMNSVQFQRLRKNEHSWNQMKKLIAFRHFRQCGDDIEPTDPKEVKAEKEKQFRKKGDPWFFEMLM